MTESQIITTSRKIQTGVRYLTTLF